MSFLLKSFRSKTRPARSDTTSSILIEEETEIPFNLLVIDYDSKNWHEIFQNTRTHTGQRIRIEKAEWSNIVVTADDFSRPVVNIKPNRNPVLHSTDNQGRTIEPDYVLVRQLVRGLTAHEDYTNALYGLLLNNTPAVNSLHAIHMCLEKPVVYAALNTVKRKVGKEAFPLISLNYYSNQTAMLFTPPYPIVVKVGHAEAGYGKMKFDDHLQFYDFRSVLALHHDYVTAERYVDNREYDIRVQKIGSHLRAFHRKSTNWKGNVGTSILEEVEVTETYKIWASESSKLFGGMDILTVDAIHCTDGTDHILEVNDTASGFAPKCEKEDMNFVKELVLQKIAETYPVVMHEDISTAPDFSTQDSTVSSVLTVDSPKSGDKKTK